MKLMSSALVALIGAILLIAGIYHPHGDTSSFTSILGGGIGLLGLGFWVINMRDPGNN